MKTYTLFQQVDINPILNTLHKSFCFFVYESKSVNVFFLFPMMFSRQNSQLKHSYQKEGLNHYKMRCTLQNLTSRRMMANASRWVVLFQCSSLSTIFLFILMLFSSSAFFNIGRSFHNYVFAFRITFHHDL